MDEWYRFEPLGDQHLPLRAAFSCGEEAPDRYLRERACWEMEQRIAAVWILYDSAANRLDICGGALAASRQVASVAIIADAKNDDVRRFYEYYGFQLLSGEPHERRLFLPMKTIERLFAERGNR